MVDGTMRMAAVKLRPEITLDPGADIAKARARTSNPISASPLNRSRRSKARGVPCRGVGCEDA